MADSAAVRMSQARSVGAKLSVDNIDGLGRAVLLLATEIAVLNDRQRVLEAVLEAKGIDVSDAVRDFQPEGPMDDMLKSESQRLATLIIDALCPPSA
jgi:hypothetical protein